MLMRLSKMRNERKVVLTFFGDGATGTGIFHESLNLASILKLPVIFVSENNQYAVSTSVKYSSPVSNIADRASAYSIPNQIVDGNDVVAVYEAVKAASVRARTGDGPTLIEGKTYRWEGHYKGDPETYRSQSEVDEQREKHDPIKLFETHLISNNLLTQDQIQLVIAEVDSEVQQAVDYAMNSPEPSIENLMDNIYAE